MAPATILNKLAQVRRCERLLRFVWGGARVVAMALALLFLCCFADWLIDRWTDTPRWLLVLFLMVQVLVAAGLAVLFVVLPGLKGLSDSTVATWVERAFPAFRHRLISAVELNRSDAATAGMSPALIAAVTREAEQKAAATDFGRAVDGRRLWWSAAVLLPVLLLVLLPVIVAPRTSAELLGRELLLPLEITRSVHFELQNVTNPPPENTTERDDDRDPHHNIHEPAICASGDRVEIRFTVRGPVSEQTTGTLRIQPEDGSAEMVPLNWEKNEADGTTTFVAKVPASSVTFRYKAWLDHDSWLGHGLGESVLRKWLPPVARMHDEGEVRFEPRPTIENQTVTIQLPKYCGLRSNGKRFEQKLDTKGDVFGMSDSTAVVTIAASKKLKRATLELLGPAAPGGPEEPLKKIKMTLDNTAQGATAAFDLDSQYTGYRVLMWDEQGFTNRVRPRRGVALLPDEPPVVTLLPERFIPERYRYTALPGEYDREGIPVVKGDSIRIAYRAKSTAGLSAARLRYRVNDAKEFALLPLSEYKSSPEVGEFELDRGIFEKIREDDRTAQVEFHAVEVKESERDLVPPRREGGGRLHFQTARIPGLKVGDKIEFYIEVLDARPEHIIGRSEARIKDVVSEEQMVAWELARRQEAARLQDLEKRQREVFDPPSEAPMP